MLPVSPAYLKRHIDFLQENEKISFNDTVRILPSDVWYYNQYGKYTGIVLTMKPCVKNVSIATKEGQKSTKYHFPYLLLTYNSGSKFDLYFAYEPISEKTRLYAPQLPNFGSETTACFGTVSQPDIRKLSLEKMKIALWNVVFKGVYTAHSKSYVYKEMETQKTISKYASEENAGKYMGTMKRLINGSMTSNKLDLFREW